MSRTNGAASVPRSTQHGPGAAPIALGTATGPDHEHRAGGVREQVIDDVVRRRRTLRARSDDE